jgi:hypothetical protein
VTKVPEKLLSLALVAKCPPADSLTNVHNVERNIQCSIFEEFSCAFQWVAHTKGGITHRVHVLGKF